MSTHDPHKAGKRPEPKTAAERRCEIRVTVDGSVRCDHGRVVDLSLHGIRVLSVQRWDENAVHRVCIKSAERELVIDARCKWCLQQGSHDHLVGLAFENATDAQERVLEMLLEDSGTTML